MPSPVRIVESRHLSSNHTDREPLCLAPDHLRVITVNDKKALIKYASPSMNELRANMVRAEGDYGTDKINGKMQRAEEAKVRTSLVVGRRDMQAGKVSVRLHGKGSIDMRSASVLALPVLCLLVSGCRSIEKASPERTADATTARVSSTNAVPVEIEDDDHVVVRGALNGHELRLVLDTGASHVVVSPAVAAAAGIQKEAKVRFGGFGNERGFARRGVADSVAVGPATAERVPVAVAPMPPVVGADGLLGLSFLRQFTFRLDYDQKLVSFASPTSNDLAGSGSVLPLQHEAPPLVVQAEVDGIPAKLVVDTGASQELILRSWFVEKHKLRERYPKRLNTVTGLGLSGQMRGEIVRLQTLKLGDYAVTNVFAEFETSADTWAGDSAGFVGASILRRFRLTFDITGRRLWIEPNASYAMASPPPASVRSGFACLPEGTDWIVQDLIADSPAAEAGVRRGDRLLEINGAPVQSLKPQEIKRAFRAKPGTRVRLRLQTGRETPRETTLILRDLL